MKKIQIKSSNYFMILVVLVLGMTRLEGYSQERHTPYPIIFIHGIMGNNETWTSTNYGITDLLKAGDTPLINGGNINISLNSTRAMHQLNATKIEDDVHLLPLSDFRKGDFYTVNFDVRATGETTVVHKFSILTIAVHSDDHVIFPNNIDCYKENDVLIIDNELMTVTQVLSDRLYVTRGDPSKYHNTLATVTNLSTQSTQAAIIKQGLGLKLAIDAIIDKTGADKVILVGHSMGGLASREYLRNYFHNNVAKLVTIGTPHKGANISNIPNSIANLILPGVDFNSEAIRDLRTSYNLFFPVSGIYLYGGNENDVPDHYNSKDINCNNQFYDNIKGLNNSRMPYIGYTWIVSDWGGTGTDRIVNSENQYFKEFGEKIMANRSHEDETADYYSLIRGLDEPGEKDLAYEIGENSINKGFITFQQDEIDTDIDIYKVNLTQNGKFTIKISANNLSSITLFQILDEDFHSKELETNINNIIEYEAQAGTYYIRIFGTATNQSWQYPYTLETQLAIPPPAAMTISPGSLQYYDVVMNSPKEKTITLTNNGTANILITSIAITGVDADQFTVAPMPPFAVTPELPLNLTVTFNPTSTGAKDAAIEITTNSPDIPTKTVSLKGNGTDHETKVLICNLTNSYYFGNTKISASRNKIFTLQNTGSNTCTISDLALEGLNPDAYLIISSPALPFDLATGETKQFTVKFSPTSIGVKNASLVISNNSDNLSPKLSIELYGNGTENPYSGTAINIVAYEYWFDDEYNTKVTATVNSENVAQLEASLPTDGLMNGLHSFHIRYKDTNGKWSSVVSEFFHKLPASPAGSRKITASEYWFDDAYATKVSEPVTPDSIITLNSGIDVSSLQNGLHGYHVRYKDDAGQWSSVVSEFFHKMPATTVGSRTITESEYWFDDAYATKVSAPVTPEQTITINSGVDVASLTNGLHSYHVRYKDDAGQWSSVVSEFFHKMPATTVGSRKITASEYWFDDAYAAKVLASVTPDQTITVNSGVDVASLTNGLHSYHVRYKDDAGQWSSVVSEFFHKLPASTLQTNLITTYRYWFDSNETEMSTVTLPDPVNPYLLIKDLNTSGLILGDHAVHFQFRDSNHLWSSVATETITVANTAPVANAGNDQSVNAGTTVTLDGSASSDADGNQLTYKWSAPAEITLSSTTDAKPTFTAPEVTASKDFTIILIVNDGREDSPADEAIITVYPRPKLQTTINTVTVTDNNDGVNDTGAFAICNSTGLNIFITKVADLNGITPSSSVKVIQQFTKTNVNFAPGNGTYPLSAYSSVINRNVALVNAAQQGTLEMRFRAFFDRNNNNLPDANESAGDWIVYTVTVNPRPKLQTIINAVTVTDNNDGVNDVGAFSICNSTGLNLFITRVADLNGVAPSGSVKVIQQFTRTNVTFAPGNGTYPLSAYSAAINRNVALVNAALPGTLEMRFRTFFDTNNNNVLDASECAGDWIVYTVTVNPVLPASISITASATAVCAGNLVTFTAKTTNGGTLPVYQWKVNNINAGTNSATYTYIPANNDVVKCVLTSSACVTGSPATSNSATITVNPRPRLQATINAVIVTDNNDGVNDVGAFSICNSTGLNLFITKVADMNGVTPSGSVKVIQQFTRTNVTFAPVNGTYPVSAYLSAINRNVTLVNAALPGTLEMRFRTFFDTNNNNVLDASECAGDWIVYTVTVNPILPASVSVAAFATAVCAGTSVTFTATPVNGGTAPVYQWKVNNLNAGTNNATYTYTPTNNDVVKCVMTSNYPCATGNPATSNSATITVNPRPRLQATINAVTVTDNSDGVNDTGVFSICNSTGLNLFITKVADLNGVVPLGSVKVIQQFTRTNVTFAPGNGTYPLSAYSVAINRNVALGNAALPGTLEMRFRTFFDTNSNNVIDASECAGDWIVYTVTVNPLPVAAGTITGSASFNAGTSGIPYSIVAITNATSYLWSYSGTGVTINSPVNPLSGYAVMLDFASSATAGTLSVNGNNTCGNGVVTKLNLTPLQKSLTIFGPNTIADSLQLFASDINSRMDDEVPGSNLKAFAIKNIEIRIVGKVSSDAFATLYDIPGRVVLIRKLHEGNLNVIPTSNVKTGLYILTVRDNGKLQTFKLILRE